MPTRVGQAIVTIDSDYRHALIEPDDTRSQMSFALFKMMDSGNPFYDWPTLHHYFAEIYVPQGIGMIPWTVVRGFDDQSAHEEGVQAGIYSTAVQGCVLVDLEDDPNHFWQGHESAVDAWIDGFIEGGGHEVFLWPDSRRDKLKRENFWRWWSKDIVTRVWPQAYFSIFFQPGARNRVRRGIDNAVQPLLDGGISPDRITPTLMTSDETGQHPIDWGELLEGIMYCKELGSNGFALWRRQFLSRQQRDGLAALDDPWAPPRSRSPRSPRSVDGQLPRNLIPNDDRFPLPPLSDLEVALGRLKAAGLETNRSIEQVMKLSGTREASAAARTRKPASRATRSPGATRRSPSRSSATPS
jgi:hypothetical protein